MQPADSEPRVLASGSRHTASTHTGTTRAGAVAKALAVPGSREHQTFLLVRQVDSATHASVSSRKVSDSAESKTHWHRARFTNITTSEVGVRAIRVPGPHRRPLATITPTRAPLPTHPQLAVLGDEPTIMRIGKIFRIRVRKLSSESKQTRSSNNRTRLRHAALDNFKLNTCIKTPQLLELA